MIVWSIRFQGSKHVRDRFDTSFFRIDLEFLLLNERLLDDGLCDRVHAIDVAVP